MPQRVQCAIIALITYTVFVISQARNSEPRRAILHNPYGCVAYVHRDTYHRLCQIDEIPIDPLFNFALYSGPRGKAIITDSGGHFRITLFSGFPVPIHLDNPRYVDVPAFKQDYVWEPGANQEEDNRGMWVMAYTFCLARKVNNNNFQKIGLCPQPAYTGHLLPNPYRMARDAKDSVPLRYADLAAGIGDAASADDFPIGDGSLDLLPAKKSWEPVENVNAIADMGLKEFHDQWNRFQKLPEELDKN